jgi:hypothetical protein
MEPNTSLQPGNFRYRTSNIFFKVTGLPSLHNVAGNLFYCQMQINNPKCLIFQILTIIQICKSSQQFCLSQDSASNRSAAAFASSLIEAPASIRAISSRRPSPLIWTTPVVTRSPLAPALALEISK